ncbi:7-cyano-7-deazaguanine synthase [Paenibacillus wenxiniae]|uniref:7-cyano-7-deazaguanine synthase n=1 Tax=Paenibacillus wenxiniae TaxID=1636843 RepID=A0ABW4RNC2_9BACL
MKQHNENKGKSHVLLISGVEAKDHSSITKMLDEGISSFLITPIAILPNRKEDYTIYLSNLESKYKLSTCETYYFEEIQALYPELEHKNVFLEHDYVYSLSNYFLTVCSLAVARTEAIESNNLWIPWTEQELQCITSSVSDYIQALNNLAMIGTSEGHDISINFPILKLNTDGLYMKSQPITLSDDKAVILFSGGLDCTVAAYIMRKLGKDISLYNVQYGQSNRNQEKYAVEKIVSELNVSQHTPYEQISLSCMKQIGGSALLNDGIELRKDNSKSEYVPFRNTNLLNIGIIYALKHNIKYIVTGGHHDDTLSPDNRLPYFECFQHVLNLQYCSKEIEMYPVLLYLGGKSELIYIGEHLKVNFKNCWSCHNFVEQEHVGEDCQACGKCGNCSTRYHAFKRVGLEDPIHYAQIPYVREKWHGWVEGSEHLLEKLAIAYPQ